MYDLVVIGDCGVDLYARVDRLPSHDEKVPGDFLGMHGGGVAANFACAASRLGARTALVAVVGEDQFGSVAVDSVAGFGVDVDHVVRIPEVTSFCFVALDDSGEKALTIIRTPTFFPRFEHVDLSLFPDTKAVHIAPFDLDVATALAAAARAAGARVTVDLEPGMVAGGFDSVAALVGEANLVMPNELCLDLLFGPDSLRYGAARLLDLGPEAIVVTRGAKGAYILDSSGEVSVPAVEVQDLRDTTGAGDCFNAALVTTWLDGRSLAEAAHLAAGAASLSITAVGARGGLPTWHEMHEFVSSRTRWGSAE